MKELHINSQIQELKNKARKHFDSSAWPTRKDEEWRRSEPQLIPFESLEHIDERASELAQKYGEAIEQSLRDSVSNVQGLEFYSWSEDGADWASPYILQKLELALEKSLDRVDLWRLSQFFYGGVIVVDKGVTIDTPFVLDIVGQDTEDIVNPFIVIIAKESSKSAFEFSYSGDAFFSAGILAYMETDSELHINQYQQVSIDSFLINTLFALSGGDRVEFKSTSGQLGGMMAIDRVYAETTGTHSHLNLNGYYLAHEDQLIDLRTYQMHETEDTNSRSLYHGLAIDEAHTVYRGLISVGTSAVETDAYLTNKNLLLSDTARMDSIPCLNILTNDVRCSHGSTTGTLDEEELFYLMSRGLDLSQAKELLIEGFFAEVLDDQFETSNERVKSDIRSRILGTIT